MFDSLIKLYQQFLSLFPSFMHLWISLILFLVLVFWLLSLVKRSLVWLILLIIFVPASIPLLKQIFESLLEFLKFLISG